MGLWIVRKNEFCLFLTRMDDYEAYCSMMDDNKDYCSLMDAINDQLGNAGWIRIDLLRARRLYLGYGTKELAHRTELLENEMIACFDKIERLLVGQPEEWAKSIRERIANKFGLQPCS